MANGWTWSSNGHRLVVARFLIPSSVGRSEKPFHECGDRSKRRKTAALAHMASPEELAFAAQAKLRQEGKRDAANLLKGVVQASPSKLKELKTTYRQTKRTEEVKPFTPDEALGLYIEADLSRSSYELIRKEAKARNADIYPRYAVLLEAKKCCYPYGVKVTEVGAEISLQELLNHTASRLVQLQMPVLEVLPGKCTLTLILISKWGFDGTTGQSEYRQKFAQSHEEIKEDCIFVTSLVPLQLFQRKAEGKVIIWQNPRPSSARFCRPIAFKFIKETVQVVKQELNSVENQIRQLTPTSVRLPCLNVIIEHQLALTMIDGKIANAITDTKSAQLCPVCGAKPSEMNDLDRVRKRVINPEALKFGLSPLHCWIRFFEYIIHLSYRLDFKKWQARGDALQTQLQERKTRIQMQLKKEMSLVVDKPKQNGIGSSNNGNTARVFFSQGSLASRITGVDCDIISRLNTILQALSSGFEIEVEKFSKYSRETAEMLIAHYPWYPIPPAVHRVLLHGSETIKEMLLPIGQMSEEAQESRNKDYKAYRRDHTRKTSRLATNEDLVHHLLATSDPVISSIRAPAVRNRRRCISRHVLDLLKSSSVPMRPNEGSSEEESDEYDQ